MKAGVDGDATWSYSEHDHWTFGYAYEVAVSAGKNGVLWPLLASFDTASRSEQKSCLAKIEQFPQTPVTSWQTPVTTAMPWANTSKDRALDADSYARKFLVRR